MPLKDPNARKAYQKAHAQKKRDENPELYKEYYRRYRKENPEKHRDIWLRKNYGITLVEWKNLFARQGFVCAICKTDKPGKYDWHTDHCHTTHAVRGILCSHCNRLLGAAKDNIRNLASAIVYLERSK
jgi:hypothetical protein